MDTAKKSNMSAKETEWCNRELTLWHSTTFRPIYTHDQLEPIMASIGFFPLIPDITDTNALNKEKEEQNVAGSGKKDDDGANVKQDKDSEEGRAAEACNKLVQWREYAFRRMNLIPGLVFCPASRPQPRLPFPRIDGMHLMSYLEFLAALEHYISPYVVVNLFLIRPTRINVRAKDYKRFYEPLVNFNIDPLNEGAVLYHYRPGTLDGIAEKKYDHLKASVGAVSCNETSKMCLRKDGIRKIDEDEKDEPSDYVSLTEAEATYGDQDWKRWRGRS